MTDVVLPPTPQPKLISTETIDRLFLELSQVTRVHTRRERDLAMLMRRLIVELRTRDPENGPAANAFEYLQQHGLSGAHVAADSAGVN